MNIWRNADTNYLNEYRSNKILTFDWFDYKINYTPDHIKNMGNGKKDGKRCIKRWVLEMKENDLIFIMNKYEYFGICLVKSRYDFKKTFKFNDGTIKPIIDVDFLDFRKPIAHNFKISKTSPDTFSKINQEGFDYNSTLDLLIDFDEKLHNKILEYVAEQSPDKISRICWNTNNWQYPSGKEGKSLDKNSYEFKNRYGHEEWIANKLRIVNGYCYSSLQTVEKYRETYNNKIFNIFLYSVDSKTNVRYLIGKINNTYIVSKKESEEIYNIFLNNGYINEMMQEIQKVNGNVTAFQKTGKDTFFNIKFLPQDLELFDEPQKIFNYKEFLQNNNHYQLLNKVVEPDTETTFNKKFIFKIGHNKGKSKAKGKSSGNEYEIDLIHNDIKDIIFEQLNNKYKNCVGTENDTGFGTKVDIVRKDKNDLIFYEIKFAHNIRIAIREALAQLMEYSYYPDKNNANKMIIISHHPASKESLKYLNKLRKDFEIPIWYNYYNPEKKELDETLY